MKICCVICELNPAHNGHQYLVDEIRNTTNCDCVVAIMSGNFVQRGLPAIYDYQTRALMALNIGFDAVLYVPTVYSLCSADKYCEYTTSVVNSLNTNYLAFGSINPIEKLKRLSNNKAFESDEFKQMFLNKLSIGESYARAYNSTLEKIENLTYFSANDMLAVNYIANLNKYITPVAITRNQNSSATTIRELINKNKLRKVRQFVNEKNYEIICNTPPLDMSKYQQVLYSNIITKDKETLKNIKNIKEGLENKIINSINNSYDFKTFNSLMKNKRYTQTFLNRLYANILLNITTNVNYQLPYIKFIAVENSSTLKVLSSQIPLITNLKNKSILNDESLYKYDTISDQIYNNITNKKLNLFPFNKIIIRQI